EVLDQEVFGVVQVVRRLRDLVERGDRGAQDVEQREGELAFAARIKEADIAQRIQGRRHDAGAHIDQRYRRTRRLERVEDLHLIRHRGHVDDFGDVRVEALERATRPLGIEGPRRDLASCEIVKNRTRHGRLADPTLVRANQNDDGLSHFGTPPTTQLRYVTER